jgi:ankyrin repeat protein
MRDQGDSKIRHIKEKLGSSGKSIPGNVPSSDELIQLALANEKLRNLNVELYAATKVGNYERVLELVEQGANLHLCERHEVHKYDNDENSPLHLASSNGSLNMVQFFIEQGAHVNAQNRRLITPLHLAVHNNHLDLIEHLIKHGANIHALDDDGGTPISWAAYVGKLDAARKLVKLGANIHQSDKNNSTPLHWACYKGHFELVKFLIEQGADLDMDNVNVDDDTPLTCAIGNGYVEITLYLIEVIKQNVKKAIK